MRPPIMIASQRNLSPLLGYTDVRCDRASVLGNPFELTHESQRPQVCAAYKDYFGRNLVASIFTPGEPVKVGSYGLQIARTFKNPTPQQFVAELNRLYDLALSGVKLRLLCWCKPLPCHVDTIQEYLLFSIGYKVEIAPCQIKLF
ncbi:hypothetical protein 2AV2_51 [Nodularia phage vB_NpeS-2AV2]|uniref:DUF4326 domain-containing protein n=3 Tax=Ravarandavirus TaxID=2843444 RepID=A0A482MK75_9CAUD|nr:hypothetical protein HWA92_gp051 [Nodularia phage vB_NpeS-2AV2]YP_009844870.1 DUF4326 domain-containing protein [Nodularia phage vB_NspS-kac68v161]ALY07503.1 hypothetical protein 2AV2_51 [Nodularia phage vB_NpeS-2AV2]QBQ73711.1 DUF4326 domain-containing protein [Nodularia phage vB_NspS-kac68v161]QBQ73906.1 DUF4326 domain-containing protein [Nodularia phage vB_NspS-kac68v162]